MIFELSELELDRSVNCAIDSKPWILNPVNLWRHTSESTLHSHYIPGRKMLDFTGYAYGAMINPDDYGPSYDNEVRTYDQNDFHVVACLVQGTRNRL